MTKADRNYINEFIKEFRKVIAENPETMKHIKGFHRGLATFHESLGCIATDLREAKLKEV